MFITLKPFTYKIILFWKGNNNSKQKSKFSVCWCEIISNWMIKIFELFLLRNIGKKYWKTLHFGNFFFSLLFLNSCYIKVCPFCYIQEDHSCQLSHIKYNAFMMNLKILMVFSNQLILWFCYQLPWSPPGKQNWWVV